MLNVVLIGRGAIASEVLKHIRPGGGVNVTGVIVRPERIAEARASLPPTIEVASAIGDFATAPRLIAECAGHGAVAEFGEEALRRGIDFLVISIGALADAALRTRLEAAAEAGGGKLVLPAGAVAGADALAAARIGGLERVVYTSRKPPGAWRGTPAEKGARSRRARRTDGAVRGRGRRGGDALSAERERGGHYRSRRGRVRPDRREADRRSGRRRQHPSKSASRERSAPSTSRCAASRCPTTPRPRRLPPTA